jgi:hypothetical protein
LADGGGLSTLPSRGDFDENALAGRAELLIKADEVSGLLDGGLDIKGETGIDLGGNTAWNDRENLASEAMSRSSMTLRWSAEPLSAVLRLSAMAFSKRGLYSACWTALKMSVGLVVASCGS